DVLRKLLRKQQPLRKNWERSWLSRRRMLFRLQPLLLRSHLQRERHPQNPFRQSPSPSRLSLSKRSNSLPQNRTSLQQRRKRKERSSGVISSSDRGYRDGSLMEGEVCSRG